MLLPSISNPDSTAFLITTVSPSGSVVVIVPAAAPLPLLSFTPANVWLFTEGCVLSVTFIVIGRAVNESLSSPVW